MWRSFVLLGLLTTTACVERALDGTALGASIVDLAGADLRGADLATVKPGIDLAAPVDLASSASPGVPCSGAVCAMNEICCGLSGAMASKCFPTGPMGGGCPFSEGGYRCDGPEDCGPGQRCYGRDVSFGGTPAQTRCRAMAGPSALLVCHTDADCDGGTCSSVPSIQPGAPALRVCK
jgi:hypothetical protein